MTTENVIPFPGKRRVEQGAAQAQNPWLGTGVFETMKLAAERQQTATAELLEVERLGAGNNEPDGRLAPSMQALLDASRRGVALRQLLERVVTLGRFDERLEPWGITNVMYGSKALGIDVSLDADSKAGPIFLKAKVPHWRKALAYDASALILERPPSGADRFSLASARFIVWQRP